MFEFIGGFLLREGIEATVGFLALVAFLMWVVLLLMATKLPKG